jgi:hypothetical protein
MLLLEERIFLIICIDKERKLLMAENPDSPTDVVLETPNFTLRVPKRTVEGAVDSFVKSFKEGSQNSSRGNKNTRS